MDGAANPLMDRKVVEKQHLQLLQTDYATHVQLPYTTTTITAATAALHNATGVMGSAKCNVTQSGVL